MAQMQFDLVSPERKLASFEASEVQIPGSEGDLTAMPDHVPVITTLRPGVVRAVGPDGAKEYVVSGGFAEITPSGTSVLAEQAVAREDVTPEFIEALQKAAAEAAENADDENRDAAAKTVADLAQLAADMV